MTKNDGHVIRQTPPQLHHAVQPVLERARRLARRRDDPVVEGRHVGERSGRVGRLVAAHEGGVVEARVAQQLAVREGAVVDGACPGSPKKSVFSYPLAITNRIQTGEYAWFERTQKRIRVGSLAQSSQCPDRVTQLPTDRCPLRLAQETPAVPQRRRLLFTAGTDQLHVDEGLGAGSAVDRRVPPPAVHLRHRHAVGREEPLHEDERLGFGDGHAWAVLDQQAERLEDGDVDHPCRRVVWIAVSVPALVGGIRVGPDCPRAGQVDGFGVVVLEEARVAEHDIVAGGEDARVGDDGVGVSDCRFRLGLCGLSAYFEAGEGDAQGLE